MNGCVCIKNNIYLDYTNINLNQQFKFKANTKYIIGNYTYLYQNPNINIDELYVKNKFQGYLINTPKTKELIIFVQMKTKLTISLAKILELSNITNKKIGYSNSQFTQDQLINLYYLYNFEKNYLEFLKVYYN